MAELTKLGRYQLKRVLGRGAMGVVYEGFDPTLGRRVAVKTILRNAAIDAETERAYSERFVREAKAVARLNHPHIVQVHDFGEENDVAYLVMEYIQGRELRGFFEAGERFELAEAGRIMGELLDALEFAHESGVIHRDVKPANVMLDAQRRAKLTDFGVARVQDSDRSAAGTMVGTPAFMSPEQIQGGKIDRRTDIFSAGVILYQLLTGEQPFSGEGAWTVAKKIMQDEPPQPSSLVKSVSPAYDAIVARALAKRPVQRYASAKEFAGALRDVAAGRPLAAPAPPAGPQPRAETKASETELEFWRSIQNRDDLDELELYLAQFPDGAYAQLARIKIGKLRGSKAPDSQATMRPDPEADAKRRAAEEAAALQARADAEARARWEAAEKAQREAEEKARREAAEKARREAEEIARRAAQAKAEAEARARKVAEELAQRQAAEKAKRDAAEKAARDAEERARQAQAMARLKQQQEAAARARKPAQDEDATVSIGAGRPTAAKPEPARSSKAIPAAIAAIVVAGAVGAYLYSSRKPAPPPVAEIPAPAPAASPVPAPKPEITAADLEKIKKETEERVRKEYADKSAAEQAAAVKAAAEKAVQEKLQAAKVAAEKAAADRAAAEKARAEQLAAAKLSSERAAADKAAAEKALAEKAAAEKAAAEKAAAARAAEEKAAADKAAAQKAAAEKAAAENKAAADSAQAMLDRFIQRKGQHSVMQVEPPNAINAIARNEVVYVNDGSCPRGQIKQVIGSDFQRGTPRTYACISLSDDRPTGDRPVSPASRPAGAKAAADQTGPQQSDLDAFKKRHGISRFQQSEPNTLYVSEIAWVVGDGRCGKNEVLKVTGPASLNGGLLRRYECVKLSE